MLTKLKNSKTTHKSEDELLDLQDDEESSNIDVLHSQDDNSGLETTRSGDEDELFSDFVKEYESHDTVGENLKSEQLA